MGKVSLSQCSSVVALLIAAQTFSSEEAESRLVKHHRDLVGPSIWLKWDREIQAAKNALAEAEANLGPEPPDIVGILYNLGRLYGYQLRYAQAVPLIERALAITEKEHGPDHLEVARSLKDLAELYSRRGQCAQAEPLLKRALAILENFHGPEHHEVAEGLDGLAALYMAERKYGQAEPLYRRALAIREKVLGPDHLGIQRSLSSLASLYLAQGQYAQVEPLYKRALSIEEETSGPEHWRVPFYLTQLAGFYRAQGQYAPAIPLYKRALAIEEKTLGLEHSDVAGKMDNLAELYRKQNQSAQAEVLKGQGLHVSRRNQMLMFFSPIEEQRHTMIKRLFEGSLYSALNMVYDTEPSPSIASSTGEWILNGKAVLVEALGQFARLVLESDRPKTPDRARELAAVRGELARLAMTSPKPGLEEARLAQKEELEARLETASRKLADIVRTQVREDPWVELIEVQRALPFDGVLLEIACFPCIKGRRHYAAWLIPPAGRGDVKFVDLGEAGVIDKAVRAFRAGAQAADAPEKLRRLAEKVLHPLEKDLSAYPRWLVSLDGNLWLVPWAALPLTDGKLALDGHSISYLVSGRDVVAPGYKIATTAPLLVADPDFDQAPTVQNVAGVNPPAPAGAATQLPGAALRGQRSLDLASLIWKRLPGTAQEAAAIRAPLAAYAKTQPVVLLGAQATETAVKQVRRPKVLVLSTHGFFLEAQDESNTFIPRLDRGDRGVFVAPESVPPPVAKPDKPLKAFENPLLRCGIVLAGANVREKSPAAPAAPGQETAPRDDGVLTGMEIVGLDLRNTDLVVLSACDTGVGDVRNGEGVAGLRQCFQLAGAKSVVATLWKIPDEDSARLMTLFFQNLAAGQGKSDALRAAQLALRDERRKAGKPDHPFFWAAFTLTGDWR